MLPGAMQCPEAGPRLRYNRAPPPDPAYIGNTAQKPIIEWLNPLKIHSESCDIHRFDSITSTTLLLPRIKKANDFTDIYTLAYALWGRKVGLFASLPGGQVKIDLHLADFRRLILLLAREWAKLLPEGTVLDDEEVVKKAAAYLRTAMSVLFAFDAWQWGLCSCGTTGPATAMLPQHQPVHFVRIDTIRPAAEIIAAGHSCLFVQTEEERFETWALQCKDMLNCARDRQLIQDPLRIRPVTRETALDVLAIASDVSVLAREGHLSVIEVYKCISSPSSTALVTELRQIHIDELYYPKKHEGTVLQVRVLSDPTIFGTGLKYAVEDRLGNAITLYTEYPLPAPAVSYNHALLKQIHPVGAVLQVKEPFAHFGSLSGQPEIHVGIPTDIFELWRDGGIEWRFGSIGEAYEMSTTLKERGNNALVKENDPLLATIFYTRALGDPSLQVGERFVLLLNRMKAYLSIDRPGAAHRDANEIDQMLAEHAASFTPSTDQQARFQHRRTTALEQIDKSNKAELGPIEVRAIEGKGRGTFATAPIKHGERIIQESPLLHVDANEHSPYQFVAYLDNSQSPRSFRHWEGVCKAIHEIIDDPRRLTRWHGLHPRIASDEAAPTYLLGQPIAEQASIDALAISYKIAKNSNSAGGSGWVLDFCGRPMAGHCLKAHYSNLNHSCLPNVFQPPFSLLGGMCANVARDIKPGEELTTTYLSTVGSLLQRKEQLSTIWNFVCQCHLCLMDEKDDNRTRHRLMTNEWPTISKADVEALKALLYKINGTYAAGRVIRPDSAQILAALAHAGKTPLDRYTWGEAAIVASGTTLYDPSEWATKRRVIRDVQFGALDAEELSDLIDVICQAGVKLGPIYPPKWSVATFYWSLTGAWLARLKRGMMPKERGASVQNKRC